VGHQVVLGVRPEAISDQHHARFETSENKLEAEVTLVQPLGSRMDVHLATPKHPHLVAQFEAFAGLEGKQALTVFVDMNRVHFFAADGAGRALVR
jgi:ABC-type sugar transport system ATPase subunit